jgi:glycerol-3-phosphate acyltransferase PlsX
VGSAPRIAIDAMGGDVGPAVMLAGAARAHARRPTIFASCCSATKRADPRRARQACPRSGASRSSIAPDVIAGDEKPSQAIRRAKTTSMGRRSPP